MTDHLPPQDSSAKFFRGERYPTVSIIFFVIAGIAFLYGIATVVFNVLQGGTFGTYSAGESTANLFKIGIPLLLAFSFQNPGVTLQTNSLGLIVLGTEKKFSRGQEVSLSWEDIKKVQKVSFNTTIIIKTHQGKKIKLGYFPGHMKEIYKIVKSHTKK